jgi:hypothetical protein
MTNDSTMNLATLWLVVAQAIVAYSVRALVAR